MRVIILFTTVIFLSGFIIPQKQKKLIGRWEIYKIEKADKRPKEKRKKYIIFFQDGKLSGGRIGENPNKIGTWSFEVKSNILTLNSTESNKDDGEYLIEKLTRKKLVLMKDSTLIYLEKTKTD